MTETSAPDPIQRNGFDRWCWERGYNNVHMAALLGLHPLTVGRYRKPFGDTERRVPDTETLQRIFDLTEGEVGWAAFQPPHLAGRTGEPAVLAAGRAD